MPLSNVDLASSGCLHIQPTCTPTGPSCVDSPFQILDRLNPWQSYPIGSVIQASKAREVSLGNCMRPPRPEISSSPETSGSSITNNNLQMRIFHRRPYLYRQLVLCNQDSNPGWVTYAFHPCLSHCLRRSFHNPLQAFAHPLLSQSRTPTRSLLGTNLQSQPLHHTALLINLIKNNWTFLCLDLFLLAKILLALIFQVLLTLPL
jgi:hypothetical protein